MRRKWLEAFKKADIDGIIEDLVRQAATIEGARGGDKREFVIRQLAKILDDRFKFGWFVEMIDGGFFYVVAKLLAPIVEIGYQKMVSEIGSDPVAEYRKLTEDKLKLENRIKELEAQLNHKEDHQTEPVVPLSDRTGIDSGSMRNLKVKKSTDKV